MASVYYKSRRQAGKKIIDFLQQKQLLTQPSTVISLNTDSLLVALDLTWLLKCPLHLYLSEDIKVPGGVSLGSVNQEGEFSYGSDISSGYQDYFYQEYHGYIEDSKREGFSQLNRELGSNEVFRNDLIKGRVIYIVIDCLDQLNSLDSLLHSIRMLTIKKLIICAPLIMSNSMSHIQQVCDNYFVDGVIDYFFGADHYFEDNTTIKREAGIKMVSDSLKTWPKN